HDLDQRRLARPRRTHNGQELPRLDDETDIFKHKRFGFGVAKIHVAKLNSPLDLPRVGRDLVMSPFERAECYVSQALEMQFYDTKIERLFDQLNRLFRELLLIADECEDHADGQIVPKRQPGRKIDRDNILKAKNYVIDGREGNFRATEPDICAHHVGVAVEPLGLAVALAIEQLQALHPSQRLDER